MKAICACSCHQQDRKEKAPQPQEDHSAVHHCCCCPCSHEDRGDDGTSDTPARPGKNTGTDDGTLAQPNPVLTPGDLHHPNPPGVWVGPRKKLFLPYLFLRANAGDTGTRPVVGPFWESPDILLLAGVEPAAAPAIPPELGQTAFAHQPNTLYAHIWNFGQAQAPEVVVEFYWCDPSLGIGPGSVHLIGQTFASLGARGSGSAHRLVKCPVPWVPTFVNGGHECLLVRIWDLASDPLSTPAWDASLNRHIGQRNIHVEQAASGQGMHGHLRLLARTVTPALTLKVGPLYGAPAQVAVARAMPHSVPWLQLRSGVRGSFPRAAVPTGQPSISAPATIGTFVPGGPGAAQHEVADDHQQIGFTTTDQPPGPGEAHIYRITASQGGQLIGGYTVVLLG